MTKKQTFVKTGKGDQQELRNSITTKEGTIYTDIVLVCDKAIGGCGNRFLFTAEEQEYFHDRQLDTPKRCPACRLRRRISVQMGQLEKKKTEELDS